MKRWSARRPLTQMLADAAATGPDAPFFQMVDGKATSFAAMDKASWDVADVMGALGVGVASRVATMIPGSPDSIAIWMGLGRLRAIEVPFNLDHKGELLASIIDYARPSHFLVHRRYVEVLRAITTSLSTPIKVWIVDDGDGPLSKRLTSLDRTANIPSAIEPVSREIPSRLEDTCLILFTSGTTGLPKGVMISWAQIDAADFIGPAIEPNILYAMTPLFHITGRQIVSRAILSRGHLVYRERFSGTHFWNDIARYGCTSASVLANFMAYLAQIGVPAEIETTSLKFIHTGRVPEAFLPIARRFAIVFATAFNMTEICPVIVSDGYREGPVGSCGRPRDGFDCRIVDDLDCEVPAGEVGELILRADQPWSFMQGYWERPEATIEAWRNQWFHTGDLFRRDEGNNFFWQGRKQDRIRRRGENISSESIEDAALRHDSVAECSAVGVDSGVWDDDIKLTIIPVAENEVDPAALRTFMAEVLPDFMLPRYIDVATGLPKTATGKVQRAQLRRLGVGPDTWDANNPLT